LAGSESAEAHRNAKTGPAKQEMLNINRSLLTLTAVISKLSERATQWIPYRDSKLTKYLENALQGNAKISIICSIAPSESAYEQSQSTLGFAIMAKKIKQTVQKNETTEDDKTMIITRLEEEIKTLKEKLRVLETTHNNKGVTKKPEKNDIEVIRVKDKLVKLVSKIATGITKPTEEVKQEHLKSKEQVKEISKAQIKIPMQDIEESTFSKMVSSSHRGEKKSMKDVEKVQSDDFLDDESPIQLPDYLNSGYYNEVLKTSGGNNSINPELTAILQESEEAFVGETITNLRKQLIECDLDRQRLRKENRECIIAVTEMTTLLETVLTELKGYRKKYGKLYND